MYAYADSHITVFIRVGTCSSIMFPEFLAVSSKDSMPDDLRGKTLGGKFLGAQSDNPC